MAQKTKKTAEEKRQEIKKLFELIDTEANKPVTGGAWMDFLDTNKRFYQYSARNQALINCQSSSAEFVAAFKKWQEYGRQVMKGEKAIYILAPRVHKYYLGKDGEKYRVNDPDRPEDATEKQYTTYVRVPVFDISQTQEAATVNEDTKLKFVAVKKRIEQANGIEAVADDGDTVKTLLETVTDYVKSKGIKIVYRDTAGTLNGYTSIMCDGKKIVLRKNATAGQTLRTLVHEYAHCVLKHDYEKDGRDVPELEAESVSYIVCSLLGVDASSYSFGYIEHWQGFKGNKTTDCKERITKTAREIIEQLEEYKTALCAEPAAA